MKRRDRGRTLCCALTLLVLAACGDGRGAGSGADAREPPVAAAGLAGCTAPEPAPAEASGADTAVTLLLVVDLPAYRLTVREGDSVVARYRIAIGAPAYPTPRGRYAISRVVWNPWWIPPASEWAAGRTRTPPGPGNPLGPVKMEFAPLYLLHGTSDSTSIGRAVSHGCIRLRNADATALAERVQRHGAPDSADEGEPTAGRGDAERPVPLARAVPVLVRYELLVVEDGVIRTYPDVYGLRGAGAGDSATRRLAAALGLGPDSARALATRLLDLARDGPATVPVP